MNNWGMFQMVLWSDAANGPVVYEFDPAGVLKAFQIANNKLNSTILSQYTPPSSFIYAGLSLSANGGQNGIVWLVTGNTDLDPQPATLHAWTRTTSLRSSGTAITNATRDQPGVFAQICTAHCGERTRLCPHALECRGGVWVIGRRPATARPLISSIVNGASFLEGAVSPGELVTIFGANLGPTPASQAQVSSGSVTNTAGSTQVLIGGTPAPILYASATQINTMVPSELEDVPRKFRCKIKGKLRHRPRLRFKLLRPPVFDG